jgi:hypothetical protein
LEKVHFLTAFPSADQPWLSVSKSPFPPHALPNSSKIARTQLFDYIPISKHDQKAGGDAMIFQNPDPVNMIAELLRC